MNNDQKEEEKGEDAQILSEQKAGRTQQTNGRAEESTDAKTATSIEEQLEALISPCLLNPGTSELIREAARYLHQASSMILY